MSTATKNRQNGLRDDAMNRNEVLSRITQTKPGQVTWSTRFVLNLIIFGVPPLLAVLSSELPGL